MRSWSEYVDICYGNESVFIIFFYAGIILLCGIGIGILSYKFYLLTKKSESSETSEKENVNK